MRGTRAEGVVDRIRALAPNGVDAVFDVTGHGFAEASIALRGGTRRVVTIADVAAAERGITVSAGEAASLRHEDFEPVLALAASAEFVTEITQTFSFARDPSRSPSERGRPPAWQDRRHRPLTV